MPDYRFPRLTGLPPYILGAVDERKEELRAQGEVVYDFPGGEWRRVQRAKGYKDIIVNGEVTFEDGACTGATPGRLLRHGRG